MEHDLTDDRVLIFSTEEILELMVKLIISSLMFYSLSVVCYPILFIQIHTIR